MKRLFKPLLIFLVIFSLCPAVFSEEVETQDKLEIHPSDYVYNDNFVIIDEKTGFPLILKKPFPVFDYGASLSWVNRVIKQTGRSNFVFQDALIGVYMNMRSINMEPLDSMIRLTVYYPGVYKFNKVPQPAVNMLNYGIDLFAAPVVKLNLWNYLTFDIGAGLHFLYEQGDRWHYIDLGLGAIGRINMPLARRWTLFLDGIASLDYGNLGNNAKMEPYDFVWQYQVSFGVRYSIKAPNRYSYIPSGRRYEEDIQKLGQKAQAKQEKKEAKERAREAKELEKALEKLEEQ